MSRPITAEQLTIVPANEASWDDIATQPPSAPGTAGKRAELRVEA